MKFIEVGTYSYNENGKLLDVVLKSGYEKICVKLGLYSHCILFVLNDKRIECYHFRMITVDEKEGKLILASENTERLIGTLIDIKPY